MKSVRGLLASGNGKLGGSIHHFDLPAVGTCPGRSAVCERVCYATHGRFVFPQVRERLRWCHEQSLRADFAARMAKEVRRKGCLVVRLHVSGDFYDAAYAAKWLEVMRRCPTPRFYFYTRSWRVAEVAEVLAVMASLPNCRSWYSADAGTGLPESVPAGVRLAWLQEDVDEKPVADLVFRVRRLRRTPRVSLPMVCPAEAGTKSAGTNCGSCGHCWK